MRTHTGTRLILVGIVGTLLWGSVETAFAQRRGKFVRHRSSVVADLPRERTRVVIGGNEFFFSGGVFYRHGTAGYIAVRGPVGARIRVLPPGHVVVRTGRYPLFLYYGTYYEFDPRRQEYVVVAPPASAPAGPNLDRIDFADGRTVYGTFEGGSGDSIQVLVEDAVQSYAIDKIVTLHFAPPAQ